MAHYGDPEAHRCILEEVAARPCAPRLIAYLRAAVMGSQGSDVGLQQLRRFPGAVELPGPHLKITLALLSMTVLASAAKPAFRKEQQRLYDILARERAALVHQGEQLKAGPSGDSSPSQWTAVSRAANASVNFTSSDISSASATAAATAAAMGSISSVLLSSPGGEGEAAETLSPLQRWEQSMDILNYCEAYANYLSGFTVLWYELFGPHYFYSAESEQPTHTRDGETTSRVTHAESGEWASSSSPSSSPLPLSTPLQGPQVPPHLYAVRWGEILTPQRRAWCQGLHNVVKELLVRILSRELPLELYALFIQYANLSLRVYLLQTLAELFEWTSHYLDVLCYVHVMRQSYSVQCEMSDLQRIWAAFDLFDHRFIDDCREFNKMYTESQGAFSEQQLMVGRTQSAEGVVGPGPGTAAFGNAAARPPLRSDTAATLSSVGAHSGQLSPDSNEEDTSSTAAGASAAASRTGGLHPSPTWLSLDGSSAAAGVADVALTGLHRIFPARDAVGNASSDAADAAHSSTSSSPDDEALSSTSEAAADADARKTKRAVYLPLFYTTCCFTWILQRSFWSMYGRSSLLLESCLGHEATPQVLRVGAKNMGEKESAALFPATSFGARRRGTAAMATIHGRASPSMGPATTRAASTATSTRAAQTPTAAALVGAAGSGSGIGGGDQRGNKVTAGVTPAPTPAAASPSRNGAAATLSNGGRPPQVPRTTPSPQPSPPPPSRVQEASAQVSVRRVIAPTDQQQGTQSSVPPVSASNSHPPTHTAPLRAAVARVGGERWGSSPGWGALLNKLARLRRPRSPALASETEADRRFDGDLGGGALIADNFAGTSLLRRAAPVAGESEDLAPAVANSVAAAAAEPEDEEQRAAASALLTCSGAPFHLQYTHRAREIQLYEDPSASFSASGSEADASELFFEEFHFLRETGCYVLSHALRNLTCYPRYPVTLLILTDNTRRPGRVAWCEHKFSVLSSPTEDRDERRGLTPWVLCAVIPHTRLASDAAVRARQEERLLQHVVFQVAGARNSRVRFCTPNSVFYVLNGGADMDGGRLYFALHLHVPNSLGDGGSVSTEEVMRAESKWAFRELGELHCSWAMPCTCNEALRVAFQVGPIDDSPA